MIGTLRECSLLDDTIIVFLSDHGDMLFNHGLVAKRLMYEEACRVPMIFAGKPVLEKKGQGYEEKLGEMADLMPTLLDLCGLDIPSTVEGIPLFSEKKHEYVYGEVSEGEKSTRMVRDERFKLIYYPCGNVIQLFDMWKTLRKPMTLEEKRLTRLKSRILVENMHGIDEAWIKDGKLVGFAAPSEFVPKSDFGLYNQRGYHWPAPKEYENIGKNA